MKTHETILKGQRLEHARIHLKEKFFGIDPVIDQIIDGVSSWYFFPEFQQRPLIINLWGMTGVGKSDLVHHLVRLLGFENRYFRFDSGELGEGTFGNVRDQIAGACPLEEAQPQIFLFDEFQLNRSIQENGQEIQNKPSRVVWQLLDEGRIAISVDCDHNHGLIRSQIKNLSYWMARGLVVNEGMVPLEFFDFFNDSESKVGCEGEESEARFVFNKLEMHSLRKIYDPRFENIHHLKTYISGLNLEELYTFVTDALDLSSKPKWLNFSKSIFFVAGNLDEVYHHSKDQSPDISPDEFHLSSLEIRLPHVKKALLRRFRSEQIARLGNNHVIYPSLSSAAFHQLIAAELKRIAMLYSQVSGLTISFGAGVSAWIFREGVLPTQGVRPLKSTVRYGIEDKMPNVLAKVRLLDTKVDQIMIEIDGGFDVDFMFEGQVIEKALFPITEKVNSLKRNRSDDMQAVVAVHEIGHAIVYMRLFGELPIKIMSVVANAESKGMVVYTQPAIFSLETLKNKVAGLFGGFEAETEIFGTELVSEGSEGDIEIATHLAISYFKENGFGGELLRVAEFSEQYEHNYHNIASMEEKAKVLLEDARNVTREILKSERKLLLEMARHLVQHTSLGREEIADFVKEFGSRALNDSLKSKKLSYKEMLFSEDVEVNSGQFELYQIEG